MKKGQHVRLSHGVPAVGSRRGGRSGGRAILGAAICFALLVAAGVLFGVLQPLSPASPSPRGDNAANVVDAPTTQADERRVLAVDGLEATHAAVDATQSPRASDVAHVPSHQMNVEESAPEAKALAASAVELTNDALLLRDASGAPVRWSPLPFLRIVNRLVHRVSLLTAKKHNDSQLLTEEELESLRRYRLGGIGLLIGRSNARQSQQMPDRSRACVAVTPSSLETPNGPSDPLFVGYTQRRHMERVHHCFAKQSMFLLAAFPAHASVFEQLEGIVALLYLGAASSRTVVIPSIRLPSGARVGLSELFDVRYLYTAAMPSTSQPVVCVLEDDEFVQLETARLDLLQKTATANDARTAPERHRSLWRRLTDTSCLISWSSERKSETPLDVLNCEEVSMVPFPLMDTGGDDGSVTQLERAVDEAVLELAGSFHRFVYMGPLVTTALALLVPAIVDDAVTSVLAHEPLHHTKQLLHCLWRLLQPHPFTRRSAHLFDVVVEEAMPSESGKARTWTERDGMGNDTGIVSARSTVPSRVFDGTSMSLRSLRVGSLALHHHPFIAQGIPCVAVLRYQRRDGERVDAQRGVGGDMCSLDANALAKVLRTTHAKAAVVVHHAATAAVEAQQLMRQLEKEFPSQEGEQLRVLGSQSLLHRSNRLTQFMKIVVDRRKLYLGGGNALLQSGFSASPSADTPFRLHNPFAAEPSMLELLTEFWSLVMSDDMETLSPWSAMGRTALLRRKGNA